MIEDEAYRTSSQYRYWSYTREALASLRHDTNHLASERVRTAIKRARDATRPHHDSKIDLGKSGQGDSDNFTIDTLTMQEELKIVSWFSSKIIEVGGAMEPPIPMEIRCTAIQYLRRFYISNSPMTYHPKQIMMCALFLATKSDHWHISLHKFASRIGNTTEEDVKAPEFLLMQGLRFTLDVRHPMRGLEGGVGDILAAIEDGTLFTDEEEKRGAPKRVGTAAECASNILRSAAQMTDAYFLYTPSQIWLSALQVADHDLVTSYVAKKLDYMGAEGLLLRDKVMKTLSSCADLLASYRSPNDDPAEAKEMKRIGKKLHLCQNPDKVDLVAVTRAKAAEKREGADGSDTEKALKKRKMERESLEKDGEVFGPELKNFHHPWHDEAYAKALPHASDIGAAVITDASLSALFQYLST